jgi:hypothetical protein
MEETNSAQQQLKLHQLQRRKEKKRIIKLIPTAGNNGNI